MLSRMRLLSRLPAPPAPPLLARAALFGSASRATTAAAVGAPAIRSLLSMRLSSSSTSGLSRMGAPSPRELEPLVAGRQGGMKPRRNVSGVITINNSWNNTKCNISDTAFQTKATVTRGTMPEHCPTPASSLALALTPALSLALTLTVALCDPAQVSGGMAGFKKSKRSSVLAMQIEPPTISLLSPSPPPLLPPSLPPSPPLFSYCILTLPAMPTGLRHGEDCHRVVYQGEAGLLLSPPHPPHPRTHPHPV